MQGRLVLVEPAAAGKHDPIDVRPVAVRRVGGWPGRDSPALGRDAVVDCPDRPGRGHLTRFSSTSGAAPAESVWAVGDVAVLRLRNGTVTNVAPAGTDIWRFMSVGGTAEDDVWIGADREIAYHWDGARLTQMFSGDASGGIYDVLARARDDVWFAGSLTTYHYDGLTIREEPLTPTVSGPRHFWWAPGDDLLADDYDGIFRWSAPARVWEMLPKPFSLEGANGGGFMFGISSRDLWWLYYSGGPLVHWDGTAWYFFPSTNTGWSSGYVAPSGELIVGGYNGRVGRLPPTPARVQDRVMEVHGRGYDVYDLTGIWASADGTAVHAVPGPYRLTSNGWERAPTSGTVSQSLNGIWGSSPTDVWAVGSYGAVAHFDGQTWSTVTTSLPSMETSTLYAISGTGPADVWAVGRNGMVGHYDGNSWTFAPRASLSDLYAVHAASPDDVWAVGKSGARQHYTIAGGWKLGAAIHCSSCGACSARARTTSGWPGFGLRPALERQRVVVDHDLRAGASQVHGDVRSRGERHLGRRPVGDTASLERNDLVRRQQPDEQSSECALGRQRRRRVAGGSIRRAILPPPLTGCRRETHSAGGAPAVDQPFERTLETREQRLVLRARFNQDRQQPRAPAAPDVGEQLVAHQRDVVGGARERAQAGVDAPPQRLGRVRDVRNIEDRRHGRDARRAAVGDDADADAGRAQAVHPGGHAARDVLLVIADQCAVEIGEHAGDPARGERRHVDLLDGGEAQIGLGRAAGAPRPSCPFRTGAARPARRASAPDKAYA